MQGKKFHTLKFKEVEQNWTLLENQLANVKRFLSLRTSTVKRDIPIKRLRNGTFVKSNTKRFTEFTDLQFISKISRAYHTFF